MSKFQKTFTTLHETIDQETGEIISASVDQEIQEFRKVTNSEEFIQVYLEKLGPILNLKTTSEYRLLLLL